MPFFRIFLFFVLFVFSEGAMASFLLVVMFVVCRMVGTGGSTCTALYRFLFWFFPLVRRWGFTVGC